MDFNDNLPIYLQISRWICDKILHGEWPAGGRIPSVRELGAQLQVNPNTVMRTYERLQSREIIFNRRGIGYFVGDDAPATIRREERRQFFDEELPALLARIRTLGITTEELLNEYNRLSNDNDHENKQ